MLEKVKLALRIKHNRLDEEILDLIDSAKVKLRIKGVVRIDETDPLIVQAVKLYCKAEMDLYEKAEDYRMSFESLVMSLALSGEYNAEWDY